MCTFLKFSYGLVNRWQVRTEKEKTKTKKKHLLSGVNMNSLKNSFQTNISSHSVTTQVDQEETQNGAITNLPCRPREQGRITRRDAQR